MCSEVKRRNGAAPTDLSLVAALDLFAMGRERWGASARYRLASVLSIFRVGFAECAHLFMDTSPAFLRIRELRRIAPRRRGCRFSAQSVVTLEAFGGQFTVRRGLKDGATWLASVRAVSVPALFGKRSDFSKSRVQSCALFDEAEFSEPGCIYDDGPIR